MKTLFTVLLVFTLVSCASAPTEEEIAQEQPKSTNECLSNLEMAKEWGECNVKTTIFSRKKAISQCQAKHAKPNQTMMLKITLQPSGRVKNVRAETGSAKNRRLETCLRQAMGKLQFAVPPTGANPTIMFPVGQ